MIPENGGEIDEAASHAHNAGSLIRVPIGGGNEAVFVEKRNGAACDGYYSGPA